MCLPKKQEPLDDNLAGVHLEHEMVLRQVERQLIMLRMRQELRIIARGSQNPFVIRMEALLQRTEWMLREERLQQTLQPMQRRR